MVGEHDKQAVVWHTMRIEDLGPADHPLRRIREVVNLERIRELCAAVLRQQRPVEHPDGAVASVDAGRLPCERKGGPEAEHGVPVARGA